MQKRRPQSSKEWNKYSVFNFPFSISVCRGFMTHPCGEKVMSCGQPLQTVCCFKTDFTSLAEKKKRPMVANKSWVKAINNTSLRLNYQVWVMSAALLILGILK